MPRQYNVDPEKDTRWKPGASANPGGMKPEDAAKRKANRDAAFALEERMLAALKNDMDANEARVLEHIRSDVLKLIHTAIEREDGKAKANVNLSSDDGSMSPSAAQDAVLEAIRRKHGGDT